jgi:two-component system sensor histidine kinase PilS (NtrC family)
VRETDRELAQRREDLADLQALHRNIIDSIHSGIVTTDVEGRITFLNLAAERMTGHRLREQAGRPLAAFLGESEEFLERVENPTLGGRPLRLERPFRTARGESLHLGMAVSALRDRDGARRGFILIFQDLTEKKALEEEIRLNDRMSALGRMAASMAHELRNPLASMFGAVQLLRKDLRLTDDQDELMQVVLEESRRLDQTIRDFLLFARPSPFHPEDADLAQVLRDSLVLLRHSAELRPDHTIRTEFAPESVPYRFDVNLMKQIFWNLAKNSLKAMPSGGELRIQIVQTEGEGPEIVFADDGIGMEAGEVQRFFQPFETAFPDGTGLGLAIVFRNVQEHRGRLDVRSAPGEGTRFTIRLPAMAAAARVGV